MSQLNSLLSSVPYDPPKDDMQLYQKLRYGYRNVIIAIVDEGVTSYLRVGEAGFGMERLYARKSGPPRGKKGGRAGGGRGRR